MQNEIAAALCTKLAAAAVFCLGSAVLFPAGAQQRPNNGSGLIESTGTVVPARTVDVSPRFDGLLSKIHFVPGQFVEKGALLFEFEPAVPRICLDRARAQLKRAEAHLRLTELTLENKQKLRQQNVASEMQVREAEAARDIAAADAAEARSNVDIAGREVTETKLYAPISGIISRPFAPEGTYITKTARQQSSLAQITQQDPIAVVSRMPLETYTAARQFVTRAKKWGQQPELLLYLPDGSKFPHAGRISSGSYELMPDTQTVEVIFEFPNPDDLLRPGEKVSIRLNAEPAGSAPSRHLEPVSQNSREVARRVTDLVTGSGRMTK
jgi:RND family efflux transporter MFP subunit